jgi:hypothetical protein
MLKRMLTPVEVKHMREFTQSSVLQSKTRPNAQTEIHTGSYVDSLLRLSLDC